MLNLEELTIIYPNRPCLPLTSADRDGSWPNRSDYSNDSARWTAYLNHLVETVFERWVQEDADLKLHSRIRLEAEGLSALWEVVNGTAIMMNKTRIVLIPSEEIDTPELCVPYEWVDVPSLAGDYYLGVQVNLQEGWLQVWGYASHHQLKSEGEYDEWQRTYTLPQADLIEDLNAMLAARQLGAIERAPIAELPSLSTTEVSELLDQLSQSSPNLARLKVPLKQWGALLENKQWRQELYHRRLEKVRANIPNRKPIKLGQWLQQPLDSIATGWQTLEELLETLSGQQQAFAYSERSSSSRDDTTSINLPEAEVQRGKVINFGMELGNSQVVLMIALMKEDERKIKVHLQVHPKQEQVLPFNLQLRVLDEEGQVFWEEQADSSTKLLQYAFRAEGGDRFQVSVGVGDVVVVEDFIL